MFRQIKHIILLIALLALGLSIYAQDTVYIANGQTTSVSVVDTVFLFDDGGPNANYSNNFDGSFHLIAPCPIVITGSIETETCCDGLILRDGPSSSSPIIGTERKGVQTINDTSTAFDMLIRFHSDGSVTRSGFSLKAYPFTDQHVAVHSLSVTDITTTSAVASWGCDDSSSRFVLTIRGLDRDDTLLVDTNTYTFLDLMPGTKYTVRVADTLNRDNPILYRTAKFRTDCSSLEMSEITITDLEGCPVTCTIGDYNNPYQDTALVDLGYRNGNSRHTVITDTAALDSITNYNLPMIPPGDTASVRLGNWLTGAQAESISYRIRVDTNLGDMLILRYSAVLENPYHTDTEQPKFTFKIADSTGLALSACYEAEFIASQTLGWNSVTRLGGQILYKDWTTVGANLTPLHGQLITITLTSYDCSLGGHFGYSYFTLKLGSKRIYSDQCGEASVCEFHVPEGFTYRWYSADDPSVTVGDSSSVTITGAGTYNCDLGFVGNPECSFTLQALAGPRYPKSQFTTQVDTTGCQYKVSFTNTSVIATDSIRTQLTSLPCEDYQWIFDGTPASTRRDASHIFLPGHHKAQLVAYLGNFGCSDTSTWEFDVEISHSAHYYDTICKGHSITFFDSVLTETGIYALTPHPTIFCDTIHYLHLVQWPAFDTVEYDTICYGDNTFFWYDGNNYSHGTTAPTYMMHTIHGCDSLVHLHLTIDSIVTARIAASTTVVAAEGDRVLLMDNSDYGESRIWEFDDRTLTSDIININFFSHTHEDSLVVTLIAIAPEPRYCTDTAQIVLHSILPEIWAPNAFTPRNDNNNRWFLVGKHINTVGVHIYDRDGMEVCHLTRMDQYWDGSNMRGGQCRQGSYAYRVFYTTVADPTTTHSFTGSILLIE